jgi:hypothetical protein
MLSGDIPGALRASRLRLERYESDFARRDVAGFEFMLGHNDRAWAALKPRLSHSGEIELWVGAAVGQRIEGKTARQFRDWIMQSSYGHAQIDGVDIPTVYLSRFIVDDRVPTDDDISLMGGLNQTSGAIKLLQASAKLKQLAFADRVDAASLQSVRELIASAGWAEGGRALKPLYVWVTWRATEGSDPTLAALRGVGINADFDSLLAQALLLGLDNKHDDAITYLRAARIEMAELGLGRLRDENRSAPYAAALTSYLLFSKTGDPLYRDEALRVARAYQRIFPFLAWPYALDALLSADGEDRLAVACKARFLDRDSFFLELSQLKPDPASPICRKFLW